MANLNDKFKKILKQLEESISDNEHLESMKVELFNLYNLFLEELGKNEEISTIRIVELAERQSKIEEKVEKLSQSLKEIQKDIYEDDEIVINCPYCNNDISIDSDEDMEEIRCPECNNVIELDWDCDCGCEGECNHDECDGNCKDGNCNENDDDM